MTPDHLRAVTAFLINLGDATGFAAGVDPSEKIATMATMLGEKYADSRMFCDAAASFVAFECGLMNLPSVAIIGRFVEKWWDKNKPKSIALPAPGAEDLAQADLSAEDRMLVGLWLRDFAAGERSHAQLALSLSILRSYARPGYAWLLEAKCDAAMLAADIAVRRGWIESDAPRQTPSDAQIAAAAETVQSAIQAIHGFDLPVEAGSETGLDREASAAQRAVLRSDKGIVVPQDSSAKPTPSAGFAQERFEVLHARKPGALAAEHLHALRMSNPALRPFAERAAHAEAVAKLKAEAFAGVALHDADESEPPPYVPGAAWNDEP